MAINYKLLLLKEETHNIKKPRICTLLNRINYINSVIVLWNIAVVIKLKKNIAGSARGM